MRGAALKPHLGRSVDVKLKGRIRENYRTDVATVLSQITTARRQGYNMREIGLVQGTKSISTWIKTPDGRPAAAMTVSAVRTRLGPRREQEVAEILLREARTIEQAIRGSFA